MRRLVARARGGRLLLILSWIVAPAYAESRQGPGAADDLFRTIASLDRAVFDAGNRCDLEKLGSFFTDDLEFYHDNGGLVHRSRQSFLESVKVNLCGKVRRELVAGTLEVYPMHGYGALQMGVHRFHHPGRDKTEPTGEAKFIHLWHNKDGTWKITRVISYDHHALAK
jgi:hypothetical protein